MVVGKVKLKKCLSKIYYLFEISTPVAPSHVQHSKNLKARKEVSFVDKVCLVAMRDSRHFMNRSMNEKFKILPDYESSASLARTDFRLHRSQNREGHH